MRISIVIPNHNRDLTNALKSFKESWVQPHEVLVINRGLERSIQRNMGIQEATGDVIFWLDSDQSISPGLIGECIDIFKCGVTAIYVPEIIVAKTWFGKLRAFERNFYDGTYVDVPRLVRKDVCPMFDERISGPEDALFGSKIPGIKAVSKNVLYHHDDVGFWEYLKKKNYYGKSMRLYKQLNPDDPCLRLSYRCFYVFVENGKYKKLISHPILTIGIIFLMIIRGIIYVKNILIDKPNR